MKLLLCTKNQNYFGFLIEKSIFEIGATNGLAKEEMNKCLKNDKFQEDVLNERIEAQKKYKIS